MKFKKSIWIRKLFLSDDFTSQMKHMCHLVLFLTIIIVFQKMSFNDLKINNEKSDTNVLLTMFVHFIHYLIIFPLVYCSFMSGGLIFFNTFKSKVRLQNSLALLPFICIQVVTRGNYPDLVITNTKANLKTCLDAGLDNFIIEIVTDNEIDLKMIHDKRIREIVVPPSYTTNNRTMFKARALQYCLEQSVNMLSNNDWIVHLDEETLMTVESLHGILNFISEGKYEFGQGLITYANGHIVNWFTTIADMTRVADDLGKVRFQFNVFHKPLFSWKGSYMIAKASAEMDIGYDFGLEGSITEDCYFAMKAYQYGYNFGFIEGEMWEKSPFTISDFIEQRKRWFQGILLVVRSKKIHWKTKWLLTIQLCSSISLPILLITFAFFPLIQFPNLSLVIMYSFVRAVSFYMFIFGFLRSVSYQNLGFIKYVFKLCFSICAIPFICLLESYAIVIGLVTKPKGFFIVKKSNIILHHIV